MAVGELPCEPQWYCETSSGSEIDTRSVMPKMKSAAARKASGCDLSAKARVYGCMESQHSERFAATSDCVPVP